MCLCRRIHVLSISKKQLALMVRILNVQTYSKETGETQACNHILSTLLPPIDTPTSFCTIREEKTNILSPLVEVGL